MKIPLSFGHYAGHSTAQNGQMLVNMMVERDEQGGKEPYYLLMRPGLKVWKDTGINAPVRGGIFLADGSAVLFVVGDTLVHINRRTGVQTTAGTIGTATGPVEFEENPTQVMVSDGADGYVYTKSSGAFAVIADADFPTPGSLTYQSTYGIIVQRGTGKFSISGINDFTSWDALDFATAEAAPDNAISCLADHEDLLVFGSKTIEPYINSGDVDFPYTRRSGAMLEIGCGAGQSPAKGENIFFWLDDKGLVRKAEGYSPIIISTRQIEKQAKALPSWSDAIGMFAVVSGHSLYILTFPSGNYTLVYDMSAGGGQWYRWTSYPNDGRWRGYCLIQDGPLILVGDYLNGKIYELDQETYQDNGQPVHWIATANEVSSEEQWIIHRRLELTVEAGVGLAAGQGEDPQVVMTYSDTQGKTWSSERWRSMGKIGNYSARPTWNRLGRSRGRVYKFEGTDPVKTVLLSTVLYPEAANG